MKVCQCPLTGYLHFYPHEHEYEKKSIIWCQCSLTGYLHFYFFHELGEEWKYHVCQCSLTGYLHFYPALRKPPVYKGLKGMFSPSFLKMLQKCYILPFFCFYKILLPLHHSRTTVSNAGSHQNSI